MTIARRLLVALFALLLAAPVLAQSQRVYTQPELDQMLAPIALYPDALLSQLLMAATYPDEVGEAARWSRANPGLQGEDAVRAVQYEDWDPSVKSLVAFPQVLARMAENPAWTQALGEAFLAQEPHVMDTVQQLRRRAQAAGNLRSGEELQVEQQGQVILVQPSSPQALYVPYYDPLVVYGPWWWPAYRPVAWAPWPGYVRPYRPGISAGFWWGAPVSLSLNFFYGNFDWHHRHARVVQPAAYYYRAPRMENRTAFSQPRRWQHEPQRRAAFAGRQENRVEPPPQRQQWRTRMEVRAPVQAPPAVSVQAQPPVAATPRPERREERQPVRLERREERQPARFERREIRQAQPQVQPTAPAARAQPPAQLQPQVRMPAAVAPQQPRADRQEPRREHREMRQGPRNEGAPRARERS